MAADSSHELIRLFVAGFPPGNAQSQISNKLSQFGAVKSIDVITSPPDAVLPREFAYVNFIPKSSSSLEQCIRLLHRTKWFGKEVRIERAKTHYLTKLKREWEEEEQKKIEETTKREITETIEKEFNTTPDLWKKGKGGRLVALLNLPRKNRRGSFLYDPTKWQRNIKVFDEEGNVMKPTKKQKTVTQTAPEDTSKESKYDLIHKEELQRETAKSLGILESILQTNRPPLLPEDNVDN